MLIRSGFAPVGDGDRFIRVTDDGVRIIVASGVVAGEPVRDTAVVRVERVRPGWTETCFRRTVSVGSASDNQITSLLNLMRYAWQFARAVAKKDHHV
jgi:hypothetical protein